MKALLISCAIRTGLVASTVAVALAIPKFAYVTALGGALFGLTVCVCIPAVAFLKITRGYAPEAAACSFPYRWLCTPRGLLPHSHAC